MASSDIENFASEFALNATTQSCERPTTDGKPLSARQDRPPLEVSNTTTYYHGGPQVHIDATTNPSKEMLTASREERYRSFDLEKPWDWRMIGGQRGTHRRADKHPVDDVRQNFANMSEEAKFEAEDETTGGEACRDRYVRQGWDGCNFLEEIIDVDREAAFGEEEFGVQENHEKTELRDTTEGGLCDDQELLVYERYRQSSFSSDEDSQTNSTALELSLGGRYDDHYAENIKEAASQVEKGHIQDKGNNTVRSVHRNTADYKWLNMGSNNEEEGMTQSHRDFWEEERLKVQLEEEVRMWKKKGRRMKHRSKGPPKSSVLTLGKNSEHIDHVMRNVLAELSLDGEEVTSEVDDEVGGKHGRPSILVPETNGSSYKLMVMAFEELLGEVEATANRNKQKLDDVLRAKEEEREIMQQERRTWFETENQLRSRISSLEIEHSRMSEMLREMGSALTVEKERRKDSRVELDRVVEMLSKEKKSHHETAKKLNTYSSTFMKLRSGLSARNSSAEDGDSLYLEIMDSVLNDMDKELHYNFQLSGQSIEQTLHSDSGLLDMNELNRLKQQRNAAEAERDQIEERLSTLLRETREGHGEMEALWLEREKLLEQKVGCLEAELHYLHSKTKRKETEVMIERQRWADELEKCTQAWARERNAWESKLKDRTRDGERWKVARDDCRTQGGLRDVVADGEQQGEEGGRMVRRLTHKKETTEPMRDAAPLVSGEICVDLGNLILGMEEVSDTECDSHRMMEVQQEKTEEWRRLAEQFKEEKEGTEKKLSATLILVTNLEQEIKAKEVRMEEEREQMEELVASKSAEVEKLKQCLKSKERDLEVTIQKFTDELKLIDKEVERERKEREQVMELHFASKRQLICDIKAKEECWEKALEIRNNELQMLEEQVKIKQKDVEELHRKLEEEKTMRERTALELQQEKTVVRKEMEEMLAEIWKVCEDEKVQAAVAKRLLPGDDLSLRRPMWESLWLEYCRARKIPAEAKPLPSTPEWELASGKVARFEKQIIEAMSAIKGLRDEVEAKEEQLLKVEEDRETEWVQREEHWAQERERLLHLIDSLQQKEVQFNEERQSKEKENAQKIEAMEELRKIEHEEAAEIISSLRGSTRELEWCLKRTNSPSRRENSTSIANTLEGSISHPLDKSNEVVQVHASYLEELDRYIFDLERRKEAGERSFRNSQTVIGGESIESSREECDMQNALVQIEQELPITSESGGDFNPILGIGDDGRLSPRISREWSPSLGGPGASSSRGSVRRVARPLERGMCLTLNGLDTSTQESLWTEGADANLSIWQPEHQKRLGLSGSFNGRSNTWMSEETRSYPGSPTRGYIALPGPSTTRRPQKWLVDVSWLEQVRKEHAWLRQQLEIERQRVSALGRVEADNRWIEAAIIRALELKRESDIKAAEMQRKLAAVETLSLTRKRGTSGH